MNRTVIQSNYNAYREDKHAAASNPADEAAESQERQVRLAEFPHSVVLQVSYAELDYANRWSWQQFGPAHGECLQADSDYPACHLRDPHSHVGKWAKYWLAKTSYNFGYNEWYFAQQADKERFLQFVPQINWGEHFPK